MSKRPTYLVGSNMPGYMPDSEPSAFTSWRAAYVSLLADLERDEQDLPDDSEEARDAIADIGETLLRARKLKYGADFGETVNGRHYWLTRA